jgi:hypothetical protein
LELYRETEELNLAKVEEAEGEDGELEEEGKGRKKKKNIL